MTGVDLDVARGNTLLNELIRSDRADLLVDAVEVELPLSTVLFQSGEPVEEVHFPLSGVVGLVTDLGGGEVVEAATIGYEGVSGISVFLGAGAPTEHAVVQVAGRAITLGADAFTRAAATVDGPFYAIMRRYAQVLFTQLARNAGCNRVHSVQQRAARWLLTTADRMRSPTFDITQEFLAQMLSVRRASVSRVARHLSSIGAITYVRGTLTIADRELLESCSCACYRVVRDATDQVLRRAAAHP